MEEILEYTGIMMIDEDENVHISFPDLPGLAVRGETVEGAMNKVVDAFNEFANSENVMVERDMPEVGLVQRDPGLFELRTNREDIREGIWYVEDLKDE